MPKLIIVESPTKARTISTFLGKDYKILSSQGHIRDLPSSKIGIDIENNFEPHYVVPKKAKSVVKELKAAKEKSSEVILATDEDREGEAIGWHIMQTLGLKDDAERIVFHEITKKAIEEALKHPRRIDMNLVLAQQARRILDRLVGYKLSPFLWKKLYRGLSAGRVQSVALRMVAERERERENFKSEEYWKVIASLSKRTGDPQVFEAELFKIGETTLKKMSLKSKEESDKIINDLKKSECKVQKIERKEVRQNPLPPFVTSTLQQEAFGRLGFSSKQTMMIAQRLYEGKNTAKGNAGLITYMRTDSFNLSEDAINRARETINNEYGGAYLSEAPRHFKSKKKNIQEAHEAIRPSDPSLLPNDLISYLTPQEYKLYDLIWRRFIATQMKEALFDSTKITIDAKGKENKYAFKASGSILKFPGFAAIWQIKSKDVSLPQIEENEDLNIRKIEGKQSFTQPPARYNEATLIKAMEEYGIGRPSTYAPIISTIISRNYIARDTQRKLYPTEIGLKVNDMLVANFKNIVDCSFTSEMEGELDDIAEGKQDWVKVLKDFYEPFEKNLELKYKEVKKEDLTEATSEICPNCGKNLIIKQGRFGRFYACSNFPECNYTRSIQNLLNVKCPECKEGEIAERKTKRGRVFYSCSRYPDCKFALWDKPIDRSCPDCGSILVQKPKMIKCSNKECSYKEGNK